MKTPQQLYTALGQEVGIPELYLKREDLHPAGSHKGRSIPLLIKQYVKTNDTRQFVISSSGNAALAAVRATTQHNKNNPQKTIVLRVYLGKHVDPKKLAQLTKEIADDSHITLQTTERPKQAAFQEAKKEGVVNLRQSTDELALLGYAELAKELDTIVNLGAVFIGTSSGTSAVGIGTAFQTLHHHPEIHIVQTTSCHPIANVFSKIPIPKETATATAIVDNIAHRKETLVSLIKESRGNGWIADNATIQTAMDLIKTHANIEVTANGALALAGLLVAQKNGWVPAAAVVCIIGGK